MTASLARQRQLKQELADESERLQADAVAGESIARNVAETRHYADELVQRMRIAERARDSRADAWYAARRLIDDANRLGELFVAQNRAQATAVSLTDQIQRKRQEAMLYREAQSSNFDRLSLFFDAIHPRDGRPKCVGQGGA